LMFLLGGLPTGRGVMENKKLVTVLVVWMLALAPVAARAQNVFITSNYPGEGLLNGPGPINFAESSLRMTVPDGTYVINAKTSIINGDDSAQTGNCKLWVLVGGLGPDGKGLPTSKLFVIDQTEFRIEPQNGGNQQAIAFQAAFNIVTTSALKPGSSLIGVDCRAFRAFDSVLIAVAIGGSIITLPPSTYEAPPPPQQF
jgi:hypothetical protein